MSSEEQAKKINEEYEMKAKEAMDKVTGDQNPKVKETVKKVQSKVLGSVEDSEKA